MTFDRLLLVVTIALGLVACDSAPPPPTAEAPKAAPPPAAPVEPEATAPHATAAVDAAAGASFGTVEQVPAGPQPHWVWVADPNLGGMPDGRAYLIDGDSGRFLGMLNTGFSFNALTLPRHYREIYSAETYYSRHTRGERTDVVSVYDPVRLAPIAEIRLPAKRASTLPRLYDTAITDDDRFMAVFNITPATSLSIVDVASHTFAGEIETPGCAMAYPAGARRIFALCTDGSALLVTLDDAGRAAAKIASAPFFDVQKDPITETGVRDGDRWWFASVDGWLHPVDLSGAEPVPGERWSLLSEEDRAADWRIGGNQHLALHRASGRLYSIMHQGEHWSYQEPGPEIWVYDLNTRERVARIAAVHPALSIEVTQDAAPLLFSIAVDEQALHVYDALSGERLRSVEGLGATLSLLQAPWQPEAPASQNSTAGTGS
jgi:methylamine dehydrogenase heavy chain